MTANQLTFTLNPALINNSYNNGTQLPGVIDVKDHLELATFTNPAQKWVDSVKINIPGYMATPLPLTFISFVPDAKDIDMTVPNVNNFLDIDNLSNNAEVFDPEDLVAQRNYPVIDPGQSVLIVVYQYYHNSLRYTGTLICNKTVDKQLVIRIDFDTLFEDDVYYVATYNTTQVFAMEYDDPAGDTAEKSIDFRFYGVKVPNTDYRLIFKELIPCILVGQNDPDIKTVGNDEIYSYTDAEYGGYNEIPLMTLNSTNVFAIPNNQNNNQRSIINNNLINTYKNQLNDIVVEKEFSKVNQPRQLQLRI